MIRLFNTILLIWVGTACAIAQSGEMFKPSLLGIAVKNVDRVSEWYVRNMGFTIREKMEFPEYDSLRIFFLERNSFRLELVQKRGAFSIHSLLPDYDTFDAKLMGLIKIEFRVDHLDQWFDRMKLAGVKFRTKIMKDEKLKERPFIVEDAEGNLVQLMERN